MAKTDYQTRHLRYSDTITEVRAYVEKNGLTVSDDEMFETVGRTLRPRDGQTNRFSVDVFKDGKPQKKMLHFQVFNDSERFELNLYRN
jgi:hypothetical protein